MMQYTDGIAAINEHRSRISGIRKEMQKIKAEMEPQKVEDYVFHNSEGAVSLSELFGDKDDLFMVHNMGTSCVYCTLWADGYNGIYDHLANRAAFVISSPDTPKVQAGFAAKRDWRFPMVSHEGSSFAADMGFGNETDGYMPGLSVFQRQDGHVVRVSDAQLGPGDDFCALWHMLDMLPGGPGEWQPKYAYSN
jgi:predicted dithiol-disulfide oxidoreductase (DUF899 family)